MQRTAVILNLWVVSASVAKCTRPFAMPDANGRNTSCRVCGKCGNLDVEDDEACSLKNCSLSLHCENHSYDQPLMLEPKLSLCTNPGEDEDCEDISLNSTGSVPSMHFCMRKRQSECVGIIFRANVFGKWYHTNYIDSCTPVGALEMQASQVVMLTVLATSAVYFVKPGFLSSLPSLLGVL